MKKKVATASDRSKCAHLTFIVNAAQTSNANKRTHVTAQCTTGFSGLNLGDVMSLAYVAYHPERGHAPTIIQQKKLLIFVC